MTASTTTELELEPHPLYKTMKEIIQYRSSQMSVPEHFVDELRSRHLTTLVNAIEKYNSRIAKELMSA